MFCRYVFVPFPSKDYCAILEVLLSLTLQVSESFFGLRLLGVILLFRWCGNGGEVVGCDKCKVLTIRFFQSTFANIVLTVRCTSSANGASLGTVAGANLPRSMTQTSGLASPVR